MNHCLWKRHELWNKNWSGSSQWLLRFYPPAQARTDLRLFHRIHSYANLISNTSEKILNESPPAIITTKRLVHRRTSSGNWNPHSVLFALCLFASRRLQLWWWLTDTTALPQAPEVAKLLRQMASHLWPPRAVTLSTQCSRATCSTKAKQNIRNGGDADSWKCLLR